MKESKKFKREVRHWPRQACLALKQPLCLMSVKVYSFMLKVVKGESRLSTVREHVLALIGLLIHKSQIMDEIFPI